MDSNFQYAGAVKRAVTPALETGRRALFADHFIGYPTEGYAFGDRGGRVAPPAADPSQATGRVKRRENQFTAPAYQKFKSSPLQRGVCELSVPCGASNFSSGRQQRVGLWPGPSFADAIDWFRDALWVRGRAGADWVMARSARARDKTAKKPTAVDRVNGPVTTEGEPMAFAGATGTTKTPA